MILYRIKYFLYTLLELHFEQVRKNTDINPITTFVFVLTLSTTIKKAVTFTYKQFIVPNELTISITNLQLSLYNNKEKGHFGRFIFIQSFHSENTLTIQNNL